LWVSYADALPPHRTTIALTTWLVLLLYAAPLLLDTPLTDPDEGLHASIAQEMLDSGEAVVPRFLGRPFLDKPILYFWTQMGSLAAFGPSAAAVRLPGMLFAVLGIASTGWLAHALFGSRAAWPAAAAYATVAVPFALAQAPVHDVALVPMANAALLALWRLINGGGIVFAVIAGAVLGISALTKGLAAVSIVGVAVAAALIVTRGVTLRLAGLGVVVLVVAAVAAAPWYVAMESRQPGYLHYYFVSRHLLGFATATQQHGDQPWWYYLPIVGAGGLPWILYVWRSRAATPIQHRGAVLLWCWLAGALVMLSIAGSKLITYALPAFPPIAILAASVWSNASVAAVERPLTRLATLHAMLFAVIAAGVPWVAADYTGGVTGPAIAVLGAVAIGWLWLAARARATALPALWTRLTIGTGVTYAAALAVLAAPMADAYSARSLAQRLNQAARFPPTLFVVNERIGSAVFYLRPELRRSLDPTRVRQIAAADLEGAVKPGDMIAIRRESLPSLGPALAAWDAYRTDAGRYAVFGPIP
jgi:4-amino-4-deoxy-L-arabinose transferase-like glycosyltransferase